jgi:hypothetical protein
MGPGVEPMDYSTDFLSRAEGSNIDIASLDWINLNAKLSFFPS